jgi:hypothetical protein
MIKLLPHDRITACERPGDDDSPVCLYCSGPSWRAVTVTSGAGALRRTLLCGEHFLEAVIQFPVLLQLEKSRAYLHASGFANASSVAS